MGHLQLISVSTVVPARPVPEAIAKFSNCLEGHQQETSIIEPTGQHIVAIGEEGEEHTVELPVSERHPKLSYHLSLLQTEQPRFLFLAEVQLIRDPKERFTTNPIRYQGDQLVKLLWYKTLANPPAEARYNGLLIHKDRHQRGDTRTAWINTVSYTAITTAVDQLKPFGTWHWIRGIQGILHLNWEYPRTRQAAQQEQAAIARARAALEEEEAAAAQADQENQPPTH